jgi:glycopeptide antibiotics resistance protein
MAQGYVVWPYAVLLAVIVMGRGVATATPRPVLLARILLVLYLGWLAGETLFPLPVTASAAHSGAAIHPGGILSDVNLVPLNSIRELLGLGFHWQTARILAGNVVVFVPFGVLLPSVVPRLAAWARVVLTGMALSLSIELTQLAVSLMLGYSHRITELDDVLLNVAGMALGFAAWRLLPSARRVAADLDATVAPTRDRC